MERMNRRWEFISHQQITEIAKNLSPAIYATDWMTDNENFAYAPAIMGKRFTFVFDDGYRLNYYFHEKKYLTWSDESRKEYRCFYRALEAPGISDVVFVHHYCDGMEKPCCTELVMDLSTGYCTAVFGCLGEEAKNPREVTRTFRFGHILEIVQSPDSRPHGFTTDLIGKAILWKMPSFTGKPPIKHIYLSPQYYGIFMTREDGSCFMSADPADYIKIRSNLYLVTIMEERRSGIQLSFLINTDLIEDVVGHFGISAGNEIGFNEPQIICTVMTGRKGRFVPMETI